MTMSPPFLGTFWREPYTAFSEPFVVDEHIIPRCTIVEVNPYCMMYNEEYFSRSSELCSERWLESKEGMPEDLYEKAQRATTRVAFAPFALGGIGCLVIAKTLWYFDFYKAPREVGKLREGLPGSRDGRHLRDKYQLYDLLVAGHHGPTLVFTRRGELGEKLRTNPQSSKATCRLNLPFLAL